MLPEPRSLASLAELYGARYRWMLLAVVCIGMVGGVLETSSFNVAIPALGREFQLGHERAQWAMTAFMAAMCLAMLPASWLIERIGFRRLFLLAVTTLGAASLVGFYSESFEVAVLARGLQGAAAGVLQPLGILVIVRIFPVAMQGRASGVLMLGLAATPAVAPAIGGVLVDALGWRAVFLLCMPFCAVALMLGVFLLPRPREVERHRFDGFGCALLCAGTLCLMSGIAGLGSGEGSFLVAAAELIVAALLVAGFVAHARRSESPIVSLELFSSRPFAMGALVSFTYGFGLFGSTYLIPVFLQDALAYSAASAGSVLIPGGVALVLATPVAGRLSDSLPPRLVAMAGLLLLGGSFLVLAALGHQRGLLAFVATTVVGRIGLGLILPALNLASMRRLQAQQLAQASVVVSFLRQLGGVLGVAATAVFVAWRQQAQGHRPDGDVTAFAQGFLLLGAIVLASVVAAARMADGRD
jgi:EmrB/QacA subfamily drug resistance transporter